MFFLMPSPVFASATQDVILSQVLPNPVGDDTESEWIELENTSSNTILLNGWTLSDAFGSTSTFSLDGISIPAHAFLTLYRPDTGIVLNNDAEKVILKDPYGNSVETAVMSKSPEGKAFAFKDGIWQWMDPVAHADTSSYQTPTPVSVQTPTPTSTPVPTSNSTPQPTQKPKQTLVINEVVACGSSPEWVEVKNLSDNALTLEGWSLSSNKVSMLKLDGVHVDAHGLYTAWLPGYYLKNTEDTVKLLEKGAVKDQFAYDSCSPTSSWSRDDEGHWYATHAITQGQENKFEKEQHNIEKKKTFSQPQNHQSFELPGFYIETPPPQSISSRSAVLGVTTYNPTNTSSIAAWFLLCGGTFLLASQYKELAIISKSLIPFVRATIEKI